MHLSVYPPPRGGGGGGRAARVMRQQNIPLTLELDSHLTIIRTHQYDSARIAYLSRWLADSAMHLALWSASVYPRFRASMRQDLSYMRLMLAYAN